MAAAVNHSVVRKFQSTLPWWERPTPQLNLTPTLCFNPRSRGGSDENVADTLAVLSVVSIHAPVVGATLSQSLFKLFHMFQSTLPWWERRAQMRIDSRYHGFQSTLPWWERPPTALIAGS